ncbi:MAG: glycosyltransferase [Bacteroidia bacterium]|nr:glycosyltransferase [Bacteroidia bacterium]
MTIFSGQTYLQKHSFCKQVLKKAPKKGLKVVIVIPCYAEKGLLDTLNSLEKNPKQNFETEVIIVLNAGEHASDAVLALNQQTEKEFEQWIKSGKKSHSYFLLKKEDLPKKHAGVGLARKIGMDEAVGRFELAEEKEGIILCLDADSAVAENYIEAVYRHFQNKPKSEACSIYFEHPLSGNEFEADVYRGIIYYELFLRYYIEGLRYAGHPYAFHTIGSSMAVRSSAYEKQNGMNRRKAGEDFYFLMKYIVDGKLSECNATSVFPSPRPADHVPFGTGKAIIKWMEGERKSYPAYDPRIFDLLKSFIDQVPDLYRRKAPVIEDVMRTFLQEQDFEANVEEMMKHVRDEASFVKRFFKWFNGLKVLKLVHYLQEHGYPDQPIEGVAEEVLRKRYADVKKGLSAKDLLLIYREKQGN